jgi:4-amino-4-deoxy-L-arabinose transferase-like glycosyltransferase
LKKLIFFTNQSNENIKIGTTILLFFLFLLINSFFFVPDGDVFYYWRWGQQLALGYLDGPPLVAYFMRVLNTLFPTTLFSLNFYAVFTTLFTSYFIYGMTNILTDNKTISLTAVLLWIISFGSLRTLLVPGGTYDNIEQLFWMASIYFVICYLKTQSNKNIYYTAICLGLLLLSKYSGVILLIGLLTFFVFYRSEQKIFKNKHFYFAIILTFTIFSPNLIWNANHQWRTFLFQLHAHLTNEAPFYAFLHLLRQFIRYYFYPIILIIFFVIKHSSPIDKKSHKYWYLFLYIYVTLVLYWFFISFFTRPRISYLTAINALLAILLSYYLVKFQYVKTLWFTISIYLIVSFILLIKPDLTIDSRQRDWFLLKKLNELYIINNNQPIIIGGSGYGFLSELSFINSNPIVSYSPLCEKGANQFLYWNLNFQRGLVSHNIKNALYVNKVNAPECIKPYFKSCTQLPTVKYKSRSEKVRTELYVYQCQN